MAEQEIDLDEKEPLIGRDQGLIYGDPKDTLQRLAEYREAGESKTAIRRDFALMNTISNREIDRAADYGESLRRGTPGHLPPRGKFYSIPAPWLKD